MKIMLFDTRLRLSDPQIQVKGDIPVEYGARERKRATARHRVEFELASFIK